MSVLAQLVSSKACTDLGDNAPTVSGAFRSGFRRAAGRHRTRLREFPVLHYVKSGTTRRAPPRIRRIPPTQPMTRTADAQTSRSVPLPSGPWGLSES